MWSLLACISFFKFSISSFAARNATIAYRSSNKSMSDIITKSCLHYCKLDTFASKINKPTIVRLRGKLNENVIQANWQQTQKVEKQKLCQSPNAWLMNGKSNIFCSSLCFLFWRELLCLWNTIKLLRLNSRRNRHSGTCHQVYPTIIDVNNNMNTKMFVSMENMDSIDFVEVVITSILINEEDGAAHNITVGKSSKSQSTKR